MAQGEICLPPKVSTHDVKIFLKILSWYISTVLQYICLQVLVIENPVLCTVGTVFFDLVDYGCI
jgi:hypothetical protein